MRAAVLRQHLMGLLARVFASGLATLALPGAAGALDPARSMAQFHHTAWLVRDGMPADTHAIAQTPDGFLWLGASGGLYRFDGVRAERFGAGRLPTLPVVSLATGDTGDLWVGFGLATLARVRRGEVTTYSVPVPGEPNPVLYLAPDRDGSVWVGTRDRVFNFDGRRWRAIGSPWPTATAFSQPGGIWGMALGRDGTLWAKNLLGLYYLRKGAAAFEPAPAGYAGSLIDFARDREGRLWTADMASRRFYALPDLQAGKPAPPPVFGAPVPPPIAGAVTLDRDGTLWNANRVTGGLYRIASVTAPAAVERFTTQQGLPSELVIAAFQDREANVWVASALGIERFRPANLIGEPAIPTRAQAAAIVATPHAVFVYSGMSATIPDPADVGRRLYRVRAGQAPDLAAPDIGQVQGIAATPDGDLVIAADDGLARWRDGVTTPIPRPSEIAGAHVLNLAAGPDDALWVSMSERGVYRLKAGRWTHITPPGVSPLEAPNVAVDGGGAAWLFYSGNRIVRVEGDRATVIPSAVLAGLGLVGATLPDGDGLILVGTGGVARFDGRAFQLLSAARQPVLSLCFGIAAAPNGDLLIATQAGVVRTTRTALLHALAHPTAPLAHQLLDAGDGFSGMPAGDMFNGAMGTGPDGRVWFLTNTHVQWIDPRRLYRNEQPPPVLIRSATANNRRYEAPRTLTLSPGTSQLQIDYTALSLAAPERVRFRYRLAGVDRTWVEAGPRRQAFYTNLQPGDYRFQVIAANNDGVWNNTGATLSVTLRPTFWQSWVFKALVALAVLAALWMLYRLRLRQVSERIRARLAERMDERERIARELHDTLLQGVAGLTLRFQAFAEQMPPDQPARKLMEEALDRADEVMAEGRDRVRDLRTRPTPGDLAQALLAAAERLRLDPDTHIELRVDGARRAAAPVVFDEVLGVAREALFNAFTHAHAEHVTVEVRYERSRLVVRIADDGVGIEAEVLDQGREGHFGLAGMRERAGKIRGQLTVHSRPAQGTDVTLAVPAHQAYARAPWRPFAAPQFEFED